MKKAILRILLVIFGLNVFTACYGMPPKDWTQPEPLTEEQQKQCDEDDESKADYTSSAEFLSQTGSFPG